MNYLAGKNVLITGGAVGIGAAISEEFLERGCRVLVHYCDEEREGAQARKFEDRCCYDFSDPLQVDQLASEALRRFGTRIDILVCSAGITLDTPLENSSLIHFEQLMQVNVGAPLFLTKALSPTLKERSGNIIFISSIHSFGGMPGHSIYAATKGALNAMTRELAIELAPHIRVNAVSPGGIEVPRQYEVNPNHIPEEFGKLVPLGIGYPEMIATTVAFLASDGAAYITGQVICVDGGATAAMPIGIAHQRKPDTPLSRQPYLEK